MPGVAQGAPQGLRVTVHFGGIRLGVDTFDVEVLRRLRRPDMDVPVRYSVALEEHTDASGTESLLLRPNDGLGDLHDP